MSRDFQPDWTMPLSEYARIQNESMPKIKPLVWVKGNPEIGEWTAETPFKNFRVIKLYLNKSAIVYMAPFQCGDCPDFLDIEDAKAWCQAEYERRVRECLE